MKGTVFYYIFIMWEQPYIILFYVAEFCLLLQLLMLYTLTILLYPLRFNNLWMASMSEVFQYDKNMCSFIFRLRCSREATLNLNGTSPLVCGCFSTLLSPNLMLLVFNVLI